MAWIRLILVALVGTGVTVLYLQNRNPVLALTFLGTQTQALPLALWIVGAIALGLFTSLMLLGLIQLSALTGRQRRRKEPRRWNFGFNQSPFFSEANSADRSAEPNWIDDDEELEVPVNSPPSTRPRTAYEVKQEPKTRSQTGSVYSYSYRESVPKQDAVPPPKPSPSTGRSGETVDAEYRVLVPPPPEPVINRPDAVEDAIDEESDWNLEGDDDWGFEDDSPRKRPPKNPEDRWN